MMKNMAIIRLPVWRFKPEMKYFTFLDYWKWWNWVWTTNDYDNQSGNILTNHIFFSIDQSELSYEVFQRIICKRLHSTKINEKIKRRIRTRFIRHHDDVIYYRDDVIYYNDDVTFRQTDATKSIDDAIPWSDDVILNQDDVILNQDDVILNQDDITMHQNDVTLHKNDVNHYDMIVNLWKRNYKMPTDSTYNSISYNSTVVTSTTIVATSSSTPWPLFSAQ